MINPTAAPTSVAGLFIEGIQPEPGGPTMPGPPPLSDGTTWAQRDAKVIANSDLFAAAKALLNCIDNITPEEFARGIDRRDREALRLAIAAAEMPAGTQIRMPNHDIVYTVDRVYLNQLGVITVCASYRARVGLDQPIDAVVLV